MPVVITLVHGTFGRLPWRDAAWTGSESTLRRRFVHGLSEDVVFVPFRWSGMNWPAARYRAAGRLRMHFDEIAARYPGRRHFVVAHSHGGNVALYAVRDGEREGQEALPRGVVCLSTPFIAAQPRPVTLFRFVATYAVILVTSFAVVANAVGYLLVPWISSLVDPANGVLSAIVLNEIWLEFLLCALLAWHATNGLVTLARARRDRIAVDDIRVPIRIVRSVGDEATAALATSAFFSWLVTLAWSVASALTIGVAALFATVPLAPVALVAGAAVAAERLVGAHAVGRRLEAVARSRRFWAFVVTLGTMGAFGAWGYVLASTPLGQAEMIYALLVATLMLAVVTFSTISGLGYGLTAPFLEVTAEATPVGSWQVQLFAARKWDTDGAPGPTRRGALSHSAAYADGEVLAATAAWIRTIQG